jgi:hypothetical protein
MKQGRHPTPRAADSRYALEIRASLRRIGPGRQATRPRPARAADAYVGRILKAGMMSGSRNE